MNLALSDVDGAILAISNFTLLADASHGRRPNFMNAQLPQQADEAVPPFCPAVPDQRYPHGDGRF